MRGRVVVVGDIVLDRDVTGRVDRVCPDAPAPVVDVQGRAQSPGGAGLSALLCARRAPTTLVAPVACDDAAGALRDTLLAAGVELVALAHDGPTRTKTRVRAAGQTLLRLDEGGPGSPGDVGADPGVADRVRAALDDAAVVLVADYGAGTTRDPLVRDLLAAAARRVPVVWDPHPRGGDPVPGCVLVTPSAAEAVQAAGAGAGADLDAVATTLLTRGQARGVAVTAGADGAWLAREGSAPLYVPAQPADGDPCGAGDRFAAEAALALREGSLPSEAVVAAVAAASAWVQTGGTAGFRAQCPSLPSAEIRSLSPAVTHDHGQVVDGVRARSGRVVATGGCFDVLHAGHVACLQAARRLGDALVVLLNSDASVRRLKGPDRPVSTQRDRARVLAALDCVDAVVVFDEDDPRAALADLRPDVWAKGGDYDGDDLPEAELVRGWGGRVVLLPYLHGRSTTEILSRTDLTQEAL